MESGVSKFTHKISDVARIVGVEKHVLRYWEEELPLTISRDAYGSRCYTEEDVERFRLIASLRQKGCQLKAIREILFGQAVPVEEVPKPETERDAAGDTEHPNAYEVDTRKKDEAATEHELGITAADATEQSQEAFPNEWEERIAQIVLRALAQYDGCTAMFWRRHLETRNEKLEDLLSQMLVEMDEMMAAREAREEMRFRQLDETIRAMQRMRAETAATTTFAAKLAAFFGKGRAQKHRKPEERDELY